MKKIVAVITVIFALALVWAGDYPIFSGPLLITSAGQSAGAVQLKVLSTKAKIKFEYDGVAKAEKLSSFKSVMIVVGASTKGLGAAGLDNDKEMARVQTILDKAKELGIPVILAHIEGASRRGATSDKLAELIAPYASLYIIVNSGNEDGKFNKLAEPKKTPIAFFDKVSAIQSILSEIIK
jgi:hypothetical protein